MMLNQMNILELDEGTVDHATHQDAELNNFSLPPAAVQNTEENTRNQDVARGCSQTNCEHDVLPWPTNPQAIPAHLNINIATLSPYYQDNHSPHSLLDPTAPWNNDPVI